MVYCRNQQHKDDRYDRYGDRYDNVMRYIRVKISFLILKAQLLCLRGSRTIKRTVEGGDDFGLCLHELRVWSVTLRDRYLSGWWSRRDAEKTKTKITVRRWRFYVMCAFLLINQWFIQWFIIQWLTFRISKRWIEKCIVKILVQPGEQKQNLTWVAWWKQNCFFIGMSCIGGPRSWPIFVTF